MTKLGLRGGLVLAVMLATPAAAEWQEIKGEELRKILVGNVFTGTKAHRGGNVKFNMWYSADGTVTVGTSDNDGDKGRWSLQGDGVCREFSYFQGLAGCSRLWIDGGNWKSEPLHGNRGEEKTGTFIKL